MPDDSPTHEQTADADRAAPRAELAWTPHDAQRTILNSDARFRVVAAGRRFGKTELATMALFTYAWNTPDARTWWVGPSYSHTDVAWETLTTNVPDLLIEDTKRTQPRRLTLTNGSRIGFRSSDSPDTLRGPGLDYLVLDEAAFIQEAAWTEVLRPTLADTEGKLLAISTPNGKNWFHRLWERGQTPDRDEYASFQFPTQANPHVADAEIERAERDNTERVFRQEWLAEFTDDSGGVFTNVRANAVEQYDWEATEGEPPYTIGVDLARTEDYTVIIALDVNGRLVEFVRARDKTWGQFQKLIMQVYREYQPSVVRIDATRDNKLVADLKQADVPVEPMSFTATTKQNLVETLAVCLDRGNLTLPEIPPLLSELGAFEYEETERGSVRYQAPPGFHDDCVDALALAACKPAWSGKIARFHFV